jgi:Putative Flp pilus-assembly TadE/G-like
MIKNSFRRVSAANLESGQAMLVTLLVLAIFLIGAVAFAVDMSHLWFRRQAAQTAADAACTAGAMDLLRTQTDSITVAPYPGNVKPGQNFNCNGASPVPVPCTYAALNGYSSSITKANAASGVLGDNVDVIFDGAPPPGVSATQVMEVDITENLPTFFAGMLQGKTTQTIRAVSKCGVNTVAAPIPLIVLDPLNPDSTTSAMSIGGNPIVTIYGGPKQSIQVNSSDTTSQGAVSFSNGGGGGGSSALIDLSQGGPKHSGSTLGVTGLPAQPPSCAGSKGFCYGTTGGWSQPQAPILDPLRNLAPPGATEVSSLTTFAGPFDSTGKDKNGVTVFGLDLDGIDGCSAKSAGNNCVVFVPGNYSAGICLGNSCPGAGSAKYAVFREGLYYMQGDLELDSGSCVRMSQTSMPSGTTYNGWGGVTFYFVGNAKLNIAANAGQPGTDCDSLQTFNTTTGLVGGPTQYGVYCDSTAGNPTNNPGNVPPTLSGNVLLAPCTAEYGDQNYTASKGRQHGILFFQDRSATGVTSNYGGGGSYAMAGTMYFHSCDSTGTSAACTFPTGAYSSSGSYFLDTLIMGGGTGTQSYILGEIIVDNLQLQGSPSIYMDLNPSTVTNIYKAALYQ